MINKYTNKQRGLLAVIMAMVMVFAGAAFVAAEVDAESYSAGTEVVEGTIEVSQYSDLKLAVADSTVSKIEIKDNITVPEGTTGTQNAYILITKDLIINGNGYSITANAVGAKDDGFPSIVSINPGDVKAKIVINDLSILNTSTVAGTSSAMVIRGSAATVELNNVDVASNSYGIEVLGSNFSMNGGTVEAWGAIYMKTGLVGATITGTEIYTKNIEGGEENNFGAVVLQELGSTVKVILDTVKITAINNDTGTEAKAYGIIYNLRNGGIGSTAGNVVLKDVEIDTSEYIGEQYAIVCGTGMNNSQTQTWNVNTTIQGSLTIKGNLDLSGNGVTCPVILDDGASISVSSGIVNATIGYKTGETTTKTAVMNIAAGSGGLTISEGSVEISGVMDADKLINAIQVAVADGADIILTNLVITTANTVNGDGNEDLNLKGVTIGSGVTIPKGVTLNAKDVVIEKGATLNIGGFISGISTITNNGTIALVDTTAKVDGAIEGTGSVDTSGVASEGVLGGTYHTDTIFTQNQTITAAEDITLVAGTEFTFQGMFIIPEGKTLIIEDGAQIIIGTTTGKLVNNGTIIIESSVSTVKTTGTDPNIVWDSGYDGAFVILGGTVENNGTIELDYTEGIVAKSGWVMNLDSGTLVNNGTITVGEESELIVNANLVNNGTLVVEGELSVNLVGVDGYKGSYTPAPMITNAGTITLSGETNGGFTVYMVSESAIVDFDGITAMHEYGSAVVISDAKFETTKTLSGNVTSSVIVDISAWDSIDGLQVTLQMVQNAKVNPNDKATYYIQLSVDGSVMASTEQSSTEAVGGIPMGASAIETEIILTGETAVSGTLEIADGVILVIANGAETAVSGTISYFDNKAETAPYDSGITVENGGVLTITGMVSGNEAMDVATSGSPVAVVNTVEYVIKATTANTSDMYYYSTLTAAVESGAKDIKAIGTVTFDESVTIPTGVTFTISAFATVDDEATITLAEGSKLKIEGTGLTMTDGVYTSGKGILVDGTLVIDDVKGTYRVPTTNGIISEVKSEGEKDVTYTNLVSALANAEAGETIVLNYSAIIDSDAEIKTDVVLKTAGKELAVDNDATLTINGTLYVSGTGSGMFTIAGESAQGEKDQGEVELNGYIKSDISIAYDAEDMPVAGAYYWVTESNVPVYYITTASNAFANAVDIDNTIGLYGDLDIGDASVSGSEDVAVVIEVYGGLEMGTLTLDLASVSFKAAEELDGTITNVVGSVAIIAESVQGLTVSSTTDDDGVKTLTISGSVAFDDENDTDGIIMIGDVEISEFDSDVITIDGNATIVKDSDIDNIVVNGSLTVSKGKELEAVTVVALGSVVIEEDDSSAGTLSVDMLLVGVDKDDIVEINTGAAASVIGNVDLGIGAYVADGCTVPEKITKLASTEYYVEGILWITAYGDLNIDDVTNAPVTDADFEEWYVSKVGDIPAATAVGAKGFEKVHADINYDIYSVTVYVGEGIGSVAIDDIILIGSNGVFNTIGPIDAGEHTISYTLKSGYEGTPTMSINGSNVDGFKFILSGTDEEDREVTITLNGVTPVTQQPVIIEPAENDGMSLTDILLIVLVVLIVIMAIIVALRMMRS